MNNLFEERRKLLLLRVIALIFKNFKMSILFFSIFLILFGIYMDVIFNGKIFVAYLFLKRFQIRNDETLFFSIPMIVSRFSSVRLM